jgi:PilZ domain
MSDNERRISPRKECFIPIRFRVLSNGSQRSAQNQNQMEGPVRVATKLHAKPGICDGETVNLSERGICFRSRENLVVGEPLEMFLTLPRELTGRRSEEVRCSARVVYVDPQADLLGRRGVGACVDHFEPVVTARSWAN